MSDTDAAGITDHVEVELGGRVVAVGTDTGLAIVTVPDPQDPPRTEGGEVVYPGGVLHVAAPVGCSPEEAAALVGEPGEVKGPSPRVWGEDSAVAFDLLQEALAAGQPGVVDTPQGDGEPVKGPGEDFAADEVVTEHDG